MSDNAVSRRLRRLVACLPTEFATLFPSSKKANADREWFEAFGPGIGLREYAYADDQEEHRFFFAGGNHAWKRENGRGQVLGPIEVKLRFATQVSAA